MKLVAAALLATILSTGAMAVPFDFIRIGDQDGFGFTPGTLPAAGPGLADVNQNGLLQQTEFLPDLNNDGASNTLDNFDNRSAAETADTGNLQGSGFTDTGSNGFKWTDIGLSTAYPTGSPGFGPFPDPSGPANPNNAHFEFRFHVDGGDIVEGSTIFFNMIFGDYDVAGSGVSLQYASAPSETVAITTQGAGQDGLIQAAFTVIDFNKVFTSDGVGGWNGLVIADFNASTDPYTAFDFVELGLDQIPATAVSAPGSLALMGIGLVAVAMRRRRAA